MNASIYWFRKCLRLHDNPSLIYALENSKIVYPVFVLDPYFVEKGNVGPNRWRFLIESLYDLDKQLKEKNSALIVLKGNPIDIIPEKIKEWGVQLLCFEKDTEPYAKTRDQKVEGLATQLGVQVHKVASHTLYDLEQLWIKNGKKVCVTYGSFQKLLANVDKPKASIQSPDKIFPSFPEKFQVKVYPIPSLKDINVNIEDCGPNLYPGGETEALKRLKDKMQHHKWVCEFEKPKTSPNSLKPSTTVLSPYLKFGNLSVRLFYEQLMKIYEESKGKHSTPPESLEGQLLWREFFYFVGAYTPNFDRIEGNPICKQIKWDQNDEYMKAWAEGRTGYPFIDAIMIQLKQEGWIHHLARHAVACFLTRGDLYQSWEQGVKVFEKLLLDADWSLNNANWMWLSASAFFNQYWKVYSPISFGKKTDPNGDYIRKYIPALKQFPKEFIYEPWNAPLQYQMACNCIIGKDYPSPIIIHADISKINLLNIKEAFQCDSNQSKPKKQLKF